MTNNGAFFPNEIDSTLLCLAEPQVHNDKGDWSAMLTYDDLPLQIQTPWLVNVFGVSEYRNSNSKISYSMSFELRTNDPSCVAFRKFLEKLDNWFIEQFKKEKIKGNYFSSIRPSKKPQYPDTLRTKLKVRKWSFDCDYMENNVRVQFTPENGRDKIKQGDRCRLVLQLMPVWSAGGRVGISWKVTSLQKQVNAEFRCADLFEDSDDNNTDDLPVSSFLRPKAPALRRSSSTFTTSNIYKPDMPSITEPDDMKTEPDEFVYPTLM